MPSPLKKRRVTTSVSTPISPVVIGFSIPPDNMEQVRNMLNVKQQQKAIIEQRRGSVVALNSPTTGPTPAPVEPPQQPNPRPPRRSPARRNNNIPSQRPPSPAQPSLPPPPISFARRRAAIMGGAKKPADIVIKPRDQHTREQFQLSIQSAPPIPHAGQSPFYGAPPGRAFNQMSIPRLPTIGFSADNPRRVATNVPPTPTRLSMQLQQNQPISTTHIQPVSNRSPPASVPIATTLVPPTPTSLHRPGYAGDKAAFLAPFDVFYDALNDSKQLKSWLGDQLQKSHSLMQSLAQQQDRIHETVEAIVDRRVGGMKAEIAGLKRRVEELEEAMAHRSTVGRYTQPTRVSSLEPATVPKKINGTSSTSPETAYTFPPAPTSSSSQDPSSSSRNLRSESSRTDLSIPGWGQQPSNSDRHSAETGRASPITFDARRPPTVPMTTRHEQPPATSGSASSMPYRERDASTISISSTSTARPPPRPPLSRQNSNSAPGVPIVVVNGERERERERTPPPPTSSSSISRRAPGSRRNSVVMTGPGEGS
ncbi:hypothetical protein M413DRAFT_401815 [Hebeloma cylindrosporum]|uniref:Uncharacterized protein n=1 Tax=Hebeloma cylindrosporum TaxID=76867 RepID=A0A0C2YQP1_HEBCY|nr:hypothetical protein M413DRAFT_401815 [Hebeloma cylindrosporum h7]